MPQYSVSDEDITILISLNNPVTACLGGAPPTLGCFNFSLAITGNLGLVSSRAAYNVHHLNSFEIESSNTLTTPSYVGPPSKS